MQLSIRAIHLTSEWTRCGWRQKSLRHVRDRMLVVVRDGVCGNRRWDCYQGERKEDGQELTGCNTQNPFETTVLPGGRANWPAR